MHGRVSLLRSLHRFVIGVAINILLLRSLNAFGCDTNSRDIVALPRCVSLVWDIPQHLPISETQKTTENAQRITNKILLLLAVRRLKDFAVMIPGRLRSFQSTSKTKSVRVLRRAVQRLHPARLRPVLCPAKTLRPRGCPG